MEILSLEKLSSGIYKVSSSDCGVFYMRPVYLRTLSEQEFLENSDFDSEFSQEIVDAGLITAAECKAVDYLARSEQSRSGLFKKLIEKGYDKDFVNPALDYLEKVKYLSDERYCRSWLNTRKINHFEGRQKLLSELLGRGIPKEIAGKALDEFFLENDENRIAEKCYSKLQKRGKTGEKLISALMQQGFSYKVAAILEKNNGKIDED